MRQHPLQFSYRSYIETESVAWATVVPVTAAAHTQFLHEVDSAGGNREMVVICAVEVTIPEAKATTTESGKIPKPTILWSVVVAAYVFHRLEDLERAAWADHVLASV